MATPDAAAAAERGSYTGDDVARFELGAALADGPVALAFFPGLFSRTCTRELCQIRDWIDELTDLNAAVYGVSADTPWSALAFIDEYDIGYPLVSGVNNGIIADYGLRREAGPLAGIADRAVVVVAAERTVEYTWRATEPLTFPDLDELAAAIGRAGVAADGR